MLSITCTPNILPWLSTEAKKISLVLLDINPDVTDEASMHFDLNVIFNCIPVRCGTIQKTDYYIGTTGGIITTEFSNATVKDFTPEQILNVNYTNSFNRTRMLSLTLAPEIKAKNKDVDLSTTIGTLQFEAGQQRNFSSTFSCTERLLTVLNMGNILTWFINLPRGEKVVRDFLLGNLYLFVECVWNDSVNDTIFGKIIVRPSDVRFFDAQRRPMGGLKSVAMIYTLWRKGIKLLNTQGCEISFRVNS